MLLTLWAWACSFQLAAAVHGTVVGEGETLPGAIVHWMGTNVGTVTDINGTFSIHRVHGVNRLVVSMVGFDTDTVVVPPTQDELNIELKPGATTLAGVTVEGNTRGNYLSSLSTAKNEIISMVGLTKMACCSLAESFENSATVSVGYSDAVSGSRQIKMLGLNGSYTQMLDESRRVMQGVSAPYALTYTPGTWLKSIQVSKGVASVAQGHEAITGQINLDYRKPTDAERLFVNFYIDDMARPELNITSAIPLTADKRLSTVVMAHGAIDTDLREMKAMDRNDDGFRDSPKSKVLSIANKWLLATAGDMQLRWGWNLVADNRTGGMNHYKNTSVMRHAMHENWFMTGEQMPAYGSHVNNSLASGYVKMALPVGSGTWDSDKNEEKRNNVAVIADYEHFKHDSYFGLNDYHATQNTASASVMYNHYFGMYSSLSAGALWKMIALKEHLVNSTPWLMVDDFNYLSRTTEHEMGAHAEYTYTRDDRITVVAGLRGDYNSRAQYFFVTPRFHLMWKPSTRTTARTSAGLGYRSFTAVADNIGTLATGRGIVINTPQRGSKDLMERALTWGASLTQTMKLGNDDNATVSLDFFSTRFFNALIADAETSTHSIKFYTTHKPCYSNSVQIDFNWTPVTRLDLMATMRYTKSMITLNLPDGTTSRVDRPLMSRLKALLNAQYATKFRIWVFDATLQVNGKSRIPSLTGKQADAEWSPTFVALFAQVTHKIGKMDLYVGCENITDYRQKNPVLNAENPFSAEFNSMNVWGPLMGRKFYAGLRLNIY